MRCKKHYTDLSSIVGVCASCLRERLFHLVAAQEQARAQSQTVEDKHRNFETHPVFPRSVSPYISRRKSDNSASEISNPQRDRDPHRSVSDQRFFSTPQVAPATGSYSPWRRKKKKNSFTPFSLISRLFRSKKRKEDESDSDPRFSVSASNYRGSYGGVESATSAMSSPFWFSAGSSRKKQPFCFNESATASRTAVIRKQYCPDRGMSPVRYSDCGGAEDELYDGSSGYETCESRKQTPWRTPSHPSIWRGGGGGHGKNVSGLAFCLSPLVRASPCRHWNNQKGMAPADGGDMRAQVKPHLANTKSFCANRSRKLADFGRANTNR